MRVIPSVVLCSALCVMLASVRADVLETGFAQPPISARPLGWWHWINGNVTKAGIVADLEAAKKAGMGGVQLFDVEMYLPPGPVRYGTDRWYEHVRFAMEKAAELGLEFHVMNTPGWSASGGPWVTPDRSMKRLVWTETSTDGGEIVLQLPLPDLTPIYSRRTVATEPFYRDIAVFAVPMTTERIPDFEKKAAWGARPITRLRETDRPGIAHDQVLNLTAKLDATGHLVATLPPGEWTLLRLGFNNSDQARRVTLDFRQVGRRPEIWDAVSGAHRDAPMFARTKTGVAVPVEFEAWGSAFVVFRKALPARWVTSAEPASLEFKGGPLVTTATEVAVSYSDGHVERLEFETLPSSQSVEGPWQVEFKHGRGAPPLVTFERLVSWTEQTDPAIRFYSGTAVYRTEFIAGAVKPGQVAVLDLGQVADIARVSLNGREIGILWKPPFRSDITSFLKEGANMLEVHVANRWINRLIGDEAVDPGFGYQNKGVNKFTDGRLLTFPDWLYDPSKRADRPRQSFSTWKHYDADSPLMPAGLLGPMKLEWLQQIRPN